MLSSRFVLHPAETVCVCIHRNVSPTERGGGGEENNSQKTQHKQARGKTQPLFASSPPRFPPRKLN